MLLSLSMCVTLTLCVVSKIFSKIFSKNFPKFFSKFLPKVFPKLRHTASTMVSLVPGLGSRKFATQVVYLSLASLGLVAANSRLHASLTLAMTRNPNLVFFQKFFPDQNFSPQNFFPPPPPPKNFFVFFQNFFQKFFPDAPPPPRRTPPPRQNFFQNCRTPIPPPPANSRRRLCTCPLRLWAW